MVKVNLRNSNSVFVVCIYRPPGSAIANFTSVLLEILNSNLLRKSKVIVLGDLNINILESNNQNDGFIYDLNALNFIPLITKPTRFDNSSRCQPSLLDHVWTNFISQYSSGILFTDISDHCPTFLHLPNLHPDLNERDKIEIKFHNHTQSNIDLFFAELSHMNWGEILCGSVDEMMSGFESTVNSLYII